MAYGVYNIENLAAYEAYRARLATDAQGRENYEFAQRERFILREHRSFTQVVPATFMQPPAVNLNEGAPR